MSILFESKKRSSFVREAKDLISKGRTKEATVVFTRGMQFYSGKALKALSPYAAEDAGILVLCLRHIASEVERNNPGTKEFVKTIGPMIHFPELSEIEKAEKTTAR